MGPLGEPVLPEPRDTEAVVILDSPERPQRRRSMTTKTGWVWHDAWGQSAADACFADFAIASIRLLARRTA
jgi:hypothetical protein